MKKALLSLTIVALLAGCATAPGGSGAGWEPVIDLRPEQQVSYPNDLVQCQGYATRVLNAQQAAVNGAIAGALVGALLGAAAGGNGRFNGRMAGVGAVGAGLGSAAEAEGGQRGIIRRCMLGRGYAVLN